MRVNVSYKHLSVLILAWAAGCGGSKAEPNNGESTATSESSSTPSATPSASASATASAAPTTKPEDREVDLSLVKTKAPKITLPKVNLEGKCDETFPIRKNSAGKIYACNIGEKEMKIGSYICQKEQFLQLDEEGLTFAGCAFTTPTKFDSLTCKTASFHKNGGMSECYLAEPIPGACTTKVVFGEDGNPTYCFGEPAGQH